MKTDPEYRSCIAYNLPASKFVNSFIKNISLSLKQNISMLNLMKTQVARYSHRKYDKVWKIPLIIVSDSIL